MFLINFGSHHHLKMSTYSVHSFVYCFVFFKFQEKCNVFDDIFQFRGKRFLLNC